MGDNSSINLKKFSPAETKSFSSLSPYISKGSARSLITLTLKTKKKYPIFDSPV